MKNQLPLLGLVCYLLACSACSTVYTPKSPDIYAFSEKKEAHFSTSANMGTVLDDHSISFTLGYSPIRHLSISAEGELASNNKIGGGNIGFYHHWTPNLLFNFKVGAGFGKLNYNARFLSEVYVANALFRRYYILPTWTWVMGGSKLGFGIGLNNYHFRNYTFKANFESNRYATAAHNFHFTNLQSVFYFEQKIIDPLKLNCFMTFNSNKRFDDYPLDSPTRKEYFIYNPVTFNLGLVLDLQSLFHKENKEPQL